MQKKCNIWQKTSYVQKRRNIWQKTSYVQKRRNIWQKTSYVQKRRNIWQKTSYVQKRRNISGAHHVQHVVCPMVRTDGSSITVDTAKLTVDFSSVLPAGLFVSWLLNVPATCECISGTDLLRQCYVLPH